MLKNNVCFETRFVYEKTCLFENRAPALAKQPLLKGRGRVGRSPGPTKMEKSELQTLQKQLS